MGKIDELIQQYCPEGVEYVPIWSLTAWDKKFNGVEKSKQTKVIKYNYLLAADLKSYQVENGTVKLLTTNISNLYTTEELSDGLASDGEVVAIPWGGNPIVQYYKGRFLTADNRIATSLDTNILNNKFLYYCMLSQMKLIASFYRGSGIKHPEMSKVLDLEIPLPPLPVQEAIVNILDRFAVYTAELQAELQARQQQYNYYRDTLLSFEGRDDVQWKKLGELCPLITKQTGFDYSNYIKDKLVREKKENHIPYIQTKFFTGRQFDFNTDYYIPEETAARFPKIVLDTKCILLSIVGASIGNIGLYDNSQKSFLGGAIGVAKPSADVNTEFIYYYLTSHSGQKQIFHKVKGAGQATITIEDIREFLVPQPSLSEQQRIVDILDRFDTLVNDLTQGLPAEIEARQQQYEYYRDQLLTFKRKEA